MKQILIKTIFSFFSKPIFFLLKLNKEYRNQLSQVWSNNLDTIVWIIENNNKPEKNNLESRTSLIQKSDLKNFEDLAFLFNCNHSNRGVVALDFDEAAYIFKTIRTNECKSILEIGRFLGGSTVLIAVAKKAEASFYSVDLKVKFPSYADDKIITSVLAKIGKPNIHLIIADSTTYIPPQKIDFVFIDGDHSYEGVKKDYQNIKKYLESGAHVLFHDAVASRDFSTKDDRVNKFIKELESDSQLKHIDNVGSICHFKYI